MFEKEAEEIMNNHCDCEMLSECLAGIRTRCSDFEESKKLLIEGIEFGYNKANEWHYTSKEDFPKSEGSYYVAMDNGRGYKSGAILNWVEETDCEEDFHWEDDDYECYDEQVYAWKECPVLPPKEIE